MVLQQHRGCVSSITLRSKKTWRLLLLMGAWMTCWCRRACASEIKKIKNENVLLLVVIISKSYLEAVRKASILVDAHKYVKKKKNIQKG